MAEQGDVQRPDTGTNAPPTLNAANRRAASDDVERLVEMLGDAVRAAGAPLGQPTIVIDRDALPRAMEIVHEQLGYQLLRSITAVDFPEVEPRFQVAYHLLRLPQSMMDGSVRPSAEDPPRALRIKVPVPVADPVVPSVTGRYPTANWHEREVWDLFGIEFAGHPDLRRILMPEAYEGHPLRKDHPMQYEEVAFSFNQEEVYGRKSFAKD